MVLSSGYIFLFPFFWQNCFRSFGRPKRTKRPRARENPWEGARWLRAAHRELALTGSDTPVLRRAPATAPSRFSQCARHPDTNSTPHPSPVPSPSDPLPTSSLPPPNPPITPNIPKFPISPHISHLVGTRRSASASTFRMKKSRELRRLPSGRYLWNPMSAANPICVICGIRGICESPGSVATHNPREYRPGGLCVIRVICETLLYRYLREICVSAESA